MAKRKKKEIVQSNDMYWLVETDDNSLFYNGREYVRPLLGDIRRTPEEYPYSFDEYWIWHDDLEDRANWATDQSDRIIAWEGYSDRYRAAIRELMISNPAKSSPLTWFKEECQSIVDALYQGKYDAVGLSQYAHLSSGHPILVFWYKEREKVHDQVT